MIEIATLTEKAPFHRTQGAPTKNFHHAQRIFFFWEGGGGGGLRESVKKQNL